MLRKKDEQVTPPEVVVESLNQVSEDAEAEAEPIAVPPVHPVEASSKEVSLFGVLHYVIQALIIV